MCMRLCVRVEEGGGGDVLVCSCVCTCKRKSILGDVVGYNLYVCLLICLHAHSLGQFLQLEVCCKLSAGLQKPQVHCKAHLPCNSLFVNTQERERERESSPPDISVNPVCVISDVSIPLPAANT